MSIILFRPSVDKVTVRNAVPHLPLGLLFIATSLVKDNYKVKIIDAEVNSHWIEELDKQPKDSLICVGVSAMTGGQILGGLKFAKVVKHKFKVPVVWGGLHASMLPEQTLKDEFVDLVVRGEGEESFLKIVRVLENGGSFKDIPNVWCKEKTIAHPCHKDHFIDLNNLPLPAYDLLDCERYIKKKPSYLFDCRRVLPVHTDRGCPHRCGFCYNLNVNKSKWRSFSASRIIEQIEYLVRDFLVDGIDFIGDNFFVSKRRVAEVCTELIKRNIKVSWHADCRIDYFVKYEDSFIELLERSGCKALTFGVESGSEKVLGLIDKDIKLDDVFKVNRRLKRSRIWAGYHFMAGFPGETKEDLRQTYKMMLKLYDQYPSANFLGPSIYTPYPGTTLYHKAVKTGFQPPRKLVDWAKFDWYQNPSLSFNGADYSRGWLMRSANIARRGTLVFKRMPWIGWWYRLRTRIIIKFSLIGPQPEEMLIRLACFLRKRLRLRATT